MIKNSGEFLDSKVGKKSGASFTRPSDSTAYTALDVVGVSAASYLTFANVCNINGCMVNILGGKMRIDSGTVVSGWTGFRLHLYNAAPTGIADNAAFNLPVADRDKYLGYITISTLVDNGDTLWVQDNNINIKVKLAENSTTLYGILQTITGYTPGSGTVYNTYLDVAGV